MKKQYDLTNLSKTLKILYSIIVILIIVTATFDILTISANKEVPISNGDITLFTIVQLGISIIHVLVRVVGFVIFLIWIYKSYSNLELFVPRFKRKSSPKMAVLWYFIPFANLVKPYQTMKEVYTWSDNDNEDVSHRLVSIWWAAFILSSFISRILLKMNDGESYFFLYIGSTIVEIILFILEIRLVLKISKWQKNILDKHQEDKVIEMSS